MCRNEFTVSLQIPYESLFSFSNCFSKLEWKPKYNSQYLVCYKHIQLKMPNDNASTFKVEYAVMSSLSLCKYLMNLCFHFQTASVNLTGNQSIMTKRRFVANSQSLTCHLCTIKVECAVMSSLSLCKTCCYAS
jgi:hypothetical protein